MAARSQFVFGYGSLVARSGRVPTRGRHPGGFVVDLPGHRRTWGVAMDNHRDIPGYKYYTDAAGRRPAVYVAFLDLVPEPGACVNGLCLPVDGAGLEALDRRELNYERVDVSDLIDAGGASVWTYVGSPPARERLRFGRSAGLAVIDAHYLAAVRAGFAWLGAAEERGCAGSLQPDGLPVVPLRRHDLPPVPLRRRDLR